MSARLQLIGTEIFYLKSKDQVVRSHDVYKNKKLLKIMDRFLNDVFGGKSVHYPKCRAV